MKLGVLASGNLGLIVLKQLNSNYHLTFVMSDKNSTGIHKFCDDLAIPYFIGNPRGFKSKEFTLGKKIDVLASINYLFIIEKDLIELPKILAFNVHGSLLPKYRGRTPHVWAIINNEIETGITVHLIDEGCDTGDILKQKKIPINKKDTGAIILKKFEVIYPELILSVLSDLSFKLPNIQKQDHSKATYFGKRASNDGLINWDWQKERIYNWVRAQAYPYPGAFSFISGEKCIIDELSFSDLGFDSNIKNGEIIGFDNKAPIVKVCNGALVLNNVRNDDFEFKMNERFSN